MQFTITTFTAVGLLAAFATAQNVGYGQELQNNDQTNHWVAWVEGESACPVARVLSTLTTSPCGQRFTLKDTTFQFCNCGSDNEPANVCDASGNVVQGCSRTSDKINCHGSQHDIVKHGHCS